MRTATAASPGGTPSAGLARLDRHFHVVSAAVLALAAFNIGYRLDAQAVTEWDEALYGLSAAEMLRTRDWIATHLLGELDYFNIKPPLNVWMVAWSFDLFGTDALPLRLPAALAAWASIALLLWWAQKAFDRRTALVAALVLSTTFGFLFVHSGRTGNPDAPWALLLVLTVIVLHRSSDSPWVSAWLGPILAAAFLLRGLGMLLPLALVAAFELWRGRTRDRARAMLVGGVIGAAVVGWWANARWTIDGTLFLGKLWSGEVARVTTPIETHAGTPFFYLNVLQKYQYEWLIAASAALWIVRGRLGGVLRSIGQRQPHSPEFVLLLVWAGLSFVVPTVMQTKTTWYLNAFYPVFALGMALLLVEAFDAAAAAAPRRLPLRMLLIVCTIAAGAAQARIVWEANRRSAVNPIHRLLTDARASLAGTAVFCQQWTYADLFVARDTLAATPQRAADVGEFLARSRRGDHLIGAATLQHPSLVRVGIAGDRGLYRRR